MNIDPRELIQYLLMGLVSGVLSFAVKFLSDISKSITKLNISMGTLIERTERHDKDIDNHENRIENLERPRSKR